MLMLQDVPTFPSVASAVPLFWDIACRSSASEAAVIVFVACESARQSLWRPAAAPDVLLQDVDNPAAAGATGASTADLRSAASKIKLGPPGSAGGFKDAFGKVAKRPEGSR